MLNLKTKREIDARLARIVNENPTFMEYLLNDEEYLEEKLGTEYQLWAAVVDAQYRIECNFGSIVATNNTITYWRVAKREGRVKDAEVNVRLAELEAKKQDYKWEEEDLYSEAQKAIRDYERFYESTDALEWLGTSNYKD